MPPPRDIGDGWESSSVGRLRGIGSFTVARGRGMEFVEIVRHFVKHKEIREQSGGGEISRKNGGREGERKGVSDDQKSTNGGFWTLPLYGQLSLSPLFYPLIQTIAVLMVYFILYLSNCQIAKTNTSAG